MSKLTYTVKKTGDSVHYSIFRDDKLVVINEVRWHDLPFFKSIFMCDDSSEKCIGYLFVLAHKLANTGIANMEKFEK